MSEFLSDVEELEEVIPPEEEALKKAEKPKDGRFRFTEKQLEALQIVSGTATHIMLYGGSRSGKTFLHVRNIVLRALKAPNSHHCILRFRFNHLKASVILGTFPKVMRLCFPGVEYNLSKTDWYVSFPNGSEIWFGGLDDKERTEKILGQEYVTMLFNEASQIPQGAKDTALTRLAELVMMVDETGKETGELTPRAYYDCNPPSKAHWTYIQFVKKLDPETKQLVSNPEDYVYFKMNPHDNAENLTAKYLQTLSNMSARMRKRFRDGEFADATPDQLFDEAAIERWRVVDGTVPDFIRIAVAVDPSGSGDVANAGNDAIGIAVAALGTDGRAYVLEDPTVKAGPATWGRVAVQAYLRYQADLLVAEGNFGGAMVEATIRTAQKELNIPRINFQLVTASRGKVIRAEPVAALYETGEVRHVGYFPELEEELAAFSTYGYLGPRSPNRADAVIWAVTALFPGIIAPRKVQQKIKYPSLGLPGTYQHG